MPAKKKRKTPKKPFVPNPPLFADRGELSRYAKSFLDIELERLNNYVTKATANVKVTDPPPFPLLFYCLSLIDFLGALYCGNASNDANYAAQSNSYIVDIMGWDEDKAKILRALFRNKLAHLAAPAPFIEFDGKRISWHLALGPTTNHFMVEKLSRPESYPLLGSYRLEFDHRFGVSITVLYYDIRDSVEKYIQALANSPDLQDKFEIAIAQVFALIPKPSPKGVTESPSE
jgi:hypothetical protein